MQVDIASRRSRMIGIASCILFATILVAGCAKRADSSKGPARGQSPVAVTTQPVRQDAVQRTVDVPGTLWGDEQSTISAKVSGRIIAISKDLGDRVQAGEVLAQIDKIDYQLQISQKELAVRESLAKLGLSEFPAADFDPSQIPMVQRTKLQLENAEARLKRGQQLHDQTPPLLSDQDYADLKTAAAVAQKNYDVELLNSHAALAEAKARKADLELAKQRLQDTTILVPQPNGPSNSGAASVGSGAEDSMYAVAERMIAIGEYVKEGTALYRLVDDDPVKLRAVVPEKHVAEIQVGQKVRVNVEAYSEDFWGRVSRVNPQVDPSNRTFQIEVVIPNPKRQLKPGGFAKASVHTRLDPNVVFAPQQAVVSFAGVSKVYVIRDNKAAEIVVETGQRRGEFVEILNGLSGKESVVVSGLNRIANGVPVVLTNQPARQADASYNQ